MGNLALQLSETEEFNYAYPNPYIKSQQMIEEIIRDTYKIDHEWKIAILRLSNIVGAFEHGYSESMSLSSLKYCSACDASRSNAA